MRSLLLVALLLAGCTGLPRQSDARNPLGWPAKLVAGAGFAAADSGVPLLRETGRLLQAVGEIFESPAMLVEGMATADGEMVTGSVRQLVVGAGASLTATYNLPFFVMPGRNIDLGQDAALVNEALAYMESLPPEKWRYYPGDTRQFVFPVGTRVRASGKNLIWTIPGYGEVLQAAEGNVLWDLVQSAAGTNFPAQERSWGFVARSRSDWNGYPPQLRAETICHEFYHQQMQMREWLMGWTVVYWPAYLTVFPFTGWHGHWAEMASTHAAGIVDRALIDWRPKAAGARGRLIRSGKKRRQLEVRGREPAQVK
jgi:hypothetical protein